MEHFVNNEQFTIQGNLESIWSLKVPHKVKNTYIIHQEVRLDMLTQTDPK